LSEEESSEEERTPSARTPVSLLVMSNYIRFGAEKRDDQRQEYMKHSILETFGLYT